ncbi:MAG: nonstructural protein [Microviridae sp. ctOsc38]|nr:MAG: nonstructural protein [Microviridae sp. ctOsc38]
MVNDPETVPSKYPADFRLVELGEWDTTTGIYSENEVPKALGSALDYKRRPQDELPLKAVQ